MRKRVRVLSVLNELYFGGHEHRLLSLARSIDHERFEHSVLTLTRDPDDAAERGAMRQQFRAAGIQVEDLGRPQEAPRRVPGLARVARSSVGIAASIPRLAALIRRRRIDVVDAHHTAAMFVAVLAARLAGARSIVTAYHTRPWESRWMRSQGMITLRWADAIVTDSHARQNDIAAWSAQPRSRVAVIPNGVEPPRPTRPPAEVRRFLGLPADPAVKVVGQISGIIPSKGHEVLLQAAARILEREPGVVFLFVGFPRGQDAFQQRLRRRIEELGLTGRICMAGYPGPIGDVWSVIDIHVHASLFDSLPNAIIEGMSLGKPAVVTAVGGIPEMVTDGETGLLVAPGDAGALEQAVTRLLRSPAEAARLGDAARRRYEARLRPEHMTAALEQLFLRVAG
jgi:glycosyltransferase involved in cell wall biosynthesis